MKRREALKSVALLLGSTISTTTINVLFEHFGEPTRLGEQLNFSAADKKLLADFADVIIPATKGVPGAKLAGLGKFIPMMMIDCYPEKERLAFYKGLLSFRQKALRDYKKDFSVMTVAEKNRYVGQVRELVIAERKSGNESQSPMIIFFILGRDLTLLGYFSSEIGCTQARSYIQIPGSYDGAAVLKPGQKSWAT